MPPKIRRWDALLARLPFNVPIIGAEVGVWNGTMSAALLKARPLLTLLMIDRWEAPPPTDSYYKSDIRSQSTPDEFLIARTRAESIATRHYGRATIIPTTTAEAAASLEPASLDFAFIDADHTYLGVKADLERWAPLVRPGGILCGHDYQNPSHPGVKRAVDEWAASTKAQLELDGDHTWFTTRA